eukprot:365540-Chlamydomonas_euryale.AAC.7
MAAAGVRCRNVLQAWHVCSEGLAVVLNGGCRSRGALCLCAACVAAGVAAHFSARQGWPLGSAVGHTCRRMPLMKPSGNKLCARVVKR